ncbi:MAG TPA: ABC transporter ATP-binding protein, partial [Phycisphaerae bacterium]|nr:ABC transporter ATP-binding protein [Phycisphaerae bacterium]
MQARPEESSHRIRLNLSTQPIAVTSTPRLVEACLRFGVSLNQPPRVIARELDLDLRPGTVTLITGPSGSGKSLVLDAIARQVPTSRLV